jgi:hypothetical protein
MKPTINKFKQIFLGTAAAMSFITPLTFAQNNIQVNVNGSADVSINISTNVNEVEQAPVQERYNTPEIKNHLSFLKEVRRLYEPENVFDMSRELINEIQTEIQSLCLLTGEELYTEYDTVLTTKLTDGFPVNRKLIRLTDISDQFLDNSLVNSQLTTQLKEVVSQNILIQEKTYSAAVYKSNGIDNITKEELSILSSVHSNPENYHNIFINTEYTRHPEFYKKQLELFHELKKLYYPNNILKLNPELINSLESQLDYYDILTNKKQTPDNTLYHKLSDKEQLKQMQKVFHHLNEYAFTRDSEGYQFKALLGIQLSRLENNLGIDNTVLNIENRQRAIAFEGLEETIKYADSVESKENNNTKNLLLASFALLGAGVGAFKVGTVYQKKKDETEQENNRYVKRRI